MNILEVSGVKKTYVSRLGSNKVEALKDVNFSIEKGEYVAIMGESGSGKTTLLNILAALDKPTGGNVLLEGKNMATIKDSEMAAFRRKNLGYIFQDFNLLDTFTLEDNIYLPLVLAGKDYKAIANTVVTYLVIFLILLLNGIRQIGFSNTIELLKSENAGEKPPKGNRIIGILGVIILAAAYYIAVEVADPVSALIWFFAAVLMVIVATYMLFIAGSVVLCKILKKNKKFYYKPKHFVSVASMVYRMKRNGAGLASVCVLMTMVLVTVSSTTCLYFGAEDALESRYPLGINTSVVFDDIDSYHNGDMKKIKSTDGCRTWNTACCGLRQQRGEQTRLLPYFWKPAVYRHDIKSCVHSSSGFDNILQADF